MRIIMGLGIVAAVVFIGTQVAGEHHKPVQPAAKPAHSLSDAKSIWVVVNKTRPLNPKTYTPAKLVIPNVPLRENITSEEEQVSSVIAEPLQQLVGAAQKDGVNLNLQSGYRSYDFQVTLYDSYVESQGVKTADMYSAKPGFSEHQTGLSVDLGGTTNPDCDVRDCFANTPEATWIANNAYKYGFIVRYLKDKQASTGYEYEPWHIRYVGKDLAKKIQAKHTVTLEEYFKLGN